MPRDGYDDDRHGFDSNTRGRIFENGTDRYFPQNERNGYQRGREIMTSLGPRRIDKSKIGKDGRLLSVEEKSGRVDSKHDAREIAKDRELMDRNIIGHHTIRTVQGERMSKEVRDLIDGMKRDFPDRFTHHEITREQARQIWALGMQREKNARQLGLMSENALRRRQRAAERLKKVREAAERLRERERKQRERDDRRRRAEERLPKVRAAAERIRLQERKRVEREAREQVAREFGGVMQNIKQQDREAKESREAKEARALAELSGLNAYAEQVRQAREAADAADQARLQEAAKAEERARLEREAIERERKQRELGDEYLRTRLPPDVTDLLFKTRPTPGLERHPWEHHAPRPTRAGRSERERLRERGRDGRGRER